MIKKFLIFFIGIIAGTVPVAFASAMSVSIQSLTPGATVFAKNNISFMVVADGFAAQYYRLTDSLSGSTASIDNINGGGNFSWTPIVSDVGSHTINITAADYSGDSANTTITITVAPPPSIAIQNVTPGAKIMPGTKLSFNVVNTGFTNPTYSMGDTFSNGSTVSNSNIDSAGNFSWTPDMSQNGQHDISVYASDALGHNFTAHLPVQVGAGPTVVISPPSPSANVSPGQTVSFFASGLNFSPSAYTVSDSFAGSSANNGTINTSGAFQWTPSGSDVGTHVLTITGTVGFYGDKASAQVTINVLGPNGVVPPPPPPAVSPAASNVAAADVSVSALQAQLAALTAQMNAAGQAAPATTPIGSPVSTASAGSQFTTYLHPGVHSDEVSALQQVLKKLGFFTDEVSGYYGNITVDAVMKFQASKGLAQLGVVGPSTRSALNAISTDAAPSTNSTTTTTSSDKFVFNNFIAFGQRGNDVLELQKRLITLGLLTSDSATGYYGSGTVAAVKAFQLAHSLDQKGYVGIGTRAALNQ